MSNQFEICEMCGSKNIWQATYSIRPYYDCNDCSFIHSSDSCSYYDFNFAVHYYAIDSTIVIDRRYKEYDSIIAELNNQTFQQYLDFCKTRLSKLGLFT